MEKNIYKIVIIGESNVGKTSLITRYTKNTFTPTSIKDRTVNAYGTEKTIYVNENILKLRIWVNIKSNFRILLVKKSIMH